MLLGTPINLSRSNFFSCKTKGLDLNLPQVPPVQHPIVCGSAKCPSMTIQPSSANRVNYFGRIGRRSQLPDIHNLFTALLLSSQDTRQGLRLLLEHSEVWAGKDRSGKVLKTEPVQWLIYTACMHSPSCLFISPKEECFHYLKKSEWLQKLNGGGKKTSFP